MAPLSPVIAVPVLSKLVADNGVHRGYKHKRIQQFAADIYLFENYANRFFGCLSIEGDHQHTVVCEVLQNLALECPNFLANPVIWVPMPMGVKAALPSVPAEALGNRIHQRGILALGGGQV